ncbi:MAG: hypothetical protein Q9212_004921 [Teloschistes hypoglaucus]
MTRKEELNALALGRKDPHANCAASLAKLSVTRQQLADWDASARAWLRAGDDANKFRRTQWMLNVRHLEKRVSMDSNVYISVINSWCGAMIAVDKLIQGAPHSITDGAILLALSAWHLFPDMLESSNSRHPVLQNDSLFDSGGMLILGFEPAQITPSPATLPFNRDVEAFSGGVTWALPLAYLRYYGNPVQRDSSLNKQESRISIDQLVQVAMGCFFHGWQEDNFDVKQAAELLCFLWQHCSETRTSSTSTGTHTDLPSDRSWLGLLAGAAGKYLLSDSSSQETYRKLFYWGREQCPGFLGMTGHPESSIVALQHPQTLVNMITDQEERLPLLRKLATKFAGDMRDMVVRYKIGVGEDERTEFAMATVVPVLSHTSENGPRHKRWLMAESSYIRTDARCGGGEAEGDVLVMTLKEDDILAHHVWRRGHLVWGNTPPEYSHGEQVTGPIDDILQESAEANLFPGQVVQGKPRIVDRSS